MQLSGGDGWGIMNGDEEGTRRAKWTYTGRGGEGIR